MEASEIVVGAQLGFAIAEVTLGAQLGSVIAEVTLGAQLGSVTAEVTLGAQVVFIIAKVRLGAHCRRLDPPHPQLNICAAPLHCYLPYISRHGRSAMRLKKNQTPSEKRAAVRDRLLEVATRLFAFHGYDDTTTRHICRLAKVSKGALYLHFRNKEDLYRTVFRRREMRFASGLRFIFRHAADDKSRVQQLHSWTANAPHLPGLCETDLGLLKGTEFNRLAVRLVARLRWWAPDVDGISFVQELRSALLAEAANDAGRPSAAPLVGQAVAPVGVG